MHVLVPSTIFAIQIIGKTIYKEMLPENQN
jgi:hypothetical protein